MSEDDLLFAEEDDDGSDKAVVDAGVSPWKVMIVDDEPSVHEITLLALRGNVFENRHVEFIHCMTGREAKKAILEHPDTAVILLDVVMETDQAGLEVARFVREEADNHLVRIILRTGQPGQAPERRVITDYDINDYKEKTELTVTKLFTLMYASIRAYRDMQTIEMAKRGLAKVIEASAGVFKLASAERFAQGVLDQMAALIKNSPQLLYAGSERNLEGLAVSYMDKEWRPIAGTGRYGDMESGNIVDMLTDERRALFDRAVNSRSDIFENDCYIAYFEDRLGNKKALLVDGVNGLDPLERRLLEIFSGNVSIAFENLNLHADLEDTQKEIVYLLGESVETRSQETGNHVKRVAEISRLLALEYGLDEEEANVLKHASPLHDLGKIGIPDHILNKPGRHTEEETTIMRTHAEIGYRMLKSSRRRILQAASIVAYEHHERWDGKGYPRGLEKENIHLYGRITAVADVFDALGSDRCYKKAWPMVQIIEHFRKERGCHFDPRLVDILLANLGAIQQIQKDYAD